MFESASSDGLNAVLFENGEPLGAEEDLKPAPSRMEVFVHGRNRGRPLPVAGRRRKSIVESTWFDFEGRDIEGENPGEIWQE